jgi:transcription initiation factor IIE alpha subunit
MYCVALLSCYSANEVRRVLFTLYSKSIYTLGREIVSKVGYIL